MEEQQSETKEGQTMKVLGFDDVLLFLAILFGYVGGSFLTNPQFNIEWKIFMVVMMFGYAFFCSFIHEYWKELGKH